MKKPELVRQVSFCVPKKTRDALDRIAKKENLSLGEATRRAVDAGLKSLKVI